MMDLTNIYASDAKLIRFRLNKGWDYVWVTYESDRGFISITSSFGNWSFIWSAMGEGTKLEEFFSRADKYYLTKKFWPTNNEDFTTYQAVEDIKKEIIEDRRNGNIKKELARVVWNEVDELGEDYEGVSRDLFMSQLSESRWFTKWNQEWWESSYGFKPKPAYLTLRDEIVPMIQKFFRGEYDGLVEKAPFTV